MCYDGCWFVVECVQNFVVVFWNWCGYVDVVLCQMLYQIQVEWQLFKCQLFEQCDDVFVCLFIFFCGQEEVGVFDFRGDVVKCVYGVYIVLIQLESDFGVGDWGENSYVLGMGNGWREMQLVYYGVGLWVLCLWYRFRILGC